MEPKYSFLVALESYAHKSMGCISRGLLTCPKDCIKSISQLTPSCQSRQSSYTVYICSTIREHFAIQKFSFCLFCGFDLLAGWRKLISRLSMKSSRRMTIRTSSFWKRSKTFLTGCDFPVLSKRSQRLSGVARSSKTNSLSNVTELSIDAHYKPQISQRYI